MAMNEDTRLTEEEGKVLQRAFRQLGLTYRILEERTGKEYSTIGRIVNGQRRIHPNFANRLYETLESQGAKNLAFLLGYCTPRFVFERPGRVYDFTRELNLGRER